MHHIRFGNGTTALWAALRALGRGDGYVAVPPTICPSVICAIVASGHRPYFVDIERQTLGLDPARLAEVLDQVQAVIAVHANGMPCQIETIAEQCRRAAIPLIEDCCQSQGGERQGLPLGQTGDVAIYSYGAGKIIEAGGGGAAETRDSSLAAAMEEIAQSLPALDEDAVRDLGLFYKFFYNQFYPDRLAHHQKVFTTLLQDLSSRLLGAYPASLDAPIASGIAGLEANLAHRRRNVDLYVHALKDIPEMVILEFPAGAAPWRLNLWMPFPLRQFVLKKMLEEKRAVSSWSPDISRFMLPTTCAATTLENSQWLTDGILNLWVDGATTERDVMETSERLHVLVDEYRQTRGALAA
jgi:dTDP-4-amino-4,6-dideoxygalactose transaminase